MWSPDTGMFLLLMDLVATCTIHVPGRLKLLTGRGKFYQTIDIKERCAAIGVKKDSITSPVQIGDFGVEIFSKYQRRHEQ